MYAIYNPEDLRLTRVTKSPKRLRTAQGLLLDDATTLPVDALKALGVFPVTDPGLPDLSGKRLTGSSVPEQLSSATADVVLLYQVEDRTAEELAVDLEQAKASALRAIDQAAEAARQLFITPGAGQAMAYQHKLEEARALQALLAAQGEPGRAAYPHLAAEIGVTGADLAGVADAVLSRAATWTGASATIEGLRLGAKAAVNAADTVAAVQVAAAGIAWPVPA